MIFSGLCDCITGKSDASKKQQPVKFAGEVVLMRKNVLDLSDYNASFLDGVHELLGKGVTFQLVSSTVADPSTGKGKLGKESSLEEWVTTLTSVAAGESKFKVHFEWDESSHGIPGAVIVKNHHHSEFYIKTLTVNGLKGKSKVHFVCNSWVYPTDKYSYDRIFFSNDTYLPSKTPAALKPYREQELVNLRGDDVQRELKEPDRVYGYATYNDLGNPKKEDEKRPTLGGPEHPYPRRGRTSRKPTKEDPNLESREGILHSLDIYVPRDERFGHLKMSDFLAYSVKAVGQALFPALRDVFDRDHEYDSFEDTFNLYDGGIPVPTGFLENLRNAIPFEFVREWVRSDGAHAFRLPLPDVLKQDRFAWRSDEEFGREMLAGVNPVLIQRLEEFPPKSKLDTSIYGDHTSTITPEDILRNLDGLSVTEALNTNRLYILDHHDNFIPYLPRINKLKGNYIYATRTLLFLNDDGTLKPVAIELSEVQNDDFSLGPKSTVYTPASEGVLSSVWQLAKAYVAVNDSGFHQLISHWMHTHAVIEPFIIATHRQLSSVHPIHKLMSPHYRDTMNINALARQTLINAKGIFESTVFPQKYALTMSSDVYKSSWKFTEQGLPDDLIKRGVAVEDPSSPNNIRLLIKDYPFAVDGMAVWSAIESWVNEYCSVYYPNDSTVKNDTELQEWWKEIVEVGHGDLKEATWWPKMHTFKELTKSLTTIIWIASALHAAVNFGQYPYCGYLPNRPTVSRRPMPVDGSDEYEELKNDPEKAYLKTITSQLQTLLGISLIEVLSRHSTDEVYLGQRDTPEWTSDDKALTAFERFSERLIGIEEKIKQLNQDEGLKNRAGPIKFPYTLLYPNTSDTSRTGGLVPKGIPNSVSI